MLGALMVQPACGGGEMAFPVACQEGEFRIEGTLAGQTVVVRESSSGGGYWRINPAGFSSQASNLAIDTSKTRLDLAWTDDFMKDQFAATGTVLMGTAGAWPGEEFCLGAGTRVDFTNEDMRFLLKGVTEAPDCTAPVAGELAGCWL
jgi:hypothetical protein